MDKWINILPCLISYLEKCATDFGLKYCRDFDTTELVNEVSTFKFHTKRAGKEHWSRVAFGYS